MTGWTVVWSVGIIGGGSLLGWWCAGRLGVPPRARWMILASYWSSSALACAAYGISAFQWPIARSLQLGHGFWVFASDAIHYHGNAQLLLGQWRQHLPVPSSVQFYDVWAAAIYWGFGPNPLYPTLFNSWFWLAATLLAWDATRRLGGSERSAAVAAVAVAWWPSAMIWSSQMLREGTLICAMLLAVDTLCVLTRPHNKFSTVTKQALAATGLLLALVWLYYTRIYVGYSFVASGLLVFGARMICSAWRRQWAAAGRWAMLLGIFIAGQGLPMGVGQFHHATGAAAAPQTIGPISASADRRWVSLDQNRETQLRPSDGIAGSGKSTGFVTRARRTGQPRGNARHRNVEPPISGEALLDYQRFAAELKSNISVASSLRGLDRMTPLKIVGVWTPPRPFRLPAVLDRLLRAISEPYRFLTPQRIQWLRLNIEVRDATMLQPPPDVGWGQITRQFIDSVGMALLRPWPSEWLDSGPHTGRMKSLAALDVVLLYLLWPAFGLGILSVLRRGSPEGFFMVGVLCFLLLVQAAVIPNLGMMVRHRLMWIILAVVLAGGSNAWWATRAVYGQAGAWLLSRGKAVWRPWGWRERRSERQKRGAASSI